MTEASELRRIGNTEVKVSFLGAGTASLGDVFGAVDEDAAEGVLRACLDTGIRYVDTAPLYGNGLSERRLGRKLADLGQPDLTLSTKVGRTLDPDAPDGWRFDFSKDAILRGFAGSLERLGVDRVDIVYLHDPDDFEHQVYAEAWPTLVALRDEGVVGAIGVGTNHWELPLTFIGRLDLDVVMIAGRYTLLDRSAADTFLPACLENGVAVVAAGVYNSGILIDPVDGAWFDYARASDDQLRRAQHFRVLAEEHGVDLPTLALHFVARHPAVTSVVVGTGSARTVARNVRALETTVPEELWELVSDGTRPARR